MKKGNRYVALKDISLSDFCPERGDILHVLAVGKDRIFVRCKCYDGTKLVETFEDMINKCDLTDVTQFKKLSKGERRPKIGKHYDDYDYDPMYPADAMTGVTNWNRY